MRRLCRCLVYRYRYVLGGMLTCVVLTACGTGIEVTEHVTDKDVRRAMEQPLGYQRTATLEAYRDSLPAWQPGKRFWVADDQVKELLVTSQDYDKDTLHLAGHVLSFKSAGTSGLYYDGDDRRWLYIDFNDEETGLPLEYRYGKAADTYHSGFSLPMLIDLDMVEHVARQIQGKDYYILTPIWYEPATEQMTNGRHFIKVHIDSVLPGNTVLPLRVHFTTADTRETAMVWMSDQSSMMHGRDFDALFSAADPHLSYPDIGNENWERITRAQVAVGMTKLECRLSLGSPKRISENPDQGGMREYWYYDGGSYLYFVDGLLSQYRR